MKQLKAAGQSSGGERAKQRKSSKNMQRVNEALLNINICMYRVKLQEARERMTQELRIEWFPRAHMGLGIV